MNWSFKNARCSFSCRSWNHGKILLLRVGRNHWTDGSFSLEIICTTFYFLLFHLFDKIAIKHTHRLFKVVIFFVLKLQKLRNLYQINCIFKIIAITIKLIKLVWSALTLLNIDIALSCLSWRVFFLQRFRIVYFKILYSSILLWVFPWWIFFNDFFCTFFNIFTKNIEIFQQFNKNIKQLIIFNMIPACLCEEFLKA